MNRKGRISTLFLLLVLILSTLNLSSLGFRFGQAGTIDFSQYWSASHLFLSSENPYNAQRMLEVQRELGSDESIPIMMWNPPWLLPLLAPLALLPFSLAALLWMLLNIVLLFLCTWLAARILKLDLSRLPLLLAGSVVFYPAAQALIWGQSSIILTTLLLLGVFFLQRLPNSFAAGVFFSFLLIKPHLFIPFGLTASWSFLRGAYFRPVAAGILTLGILSVLAELQLPGVFQSWIAAVSTPESASGVIGVREWLGSTPSAVLRLVLFGVNGQFVLWPMWVAVLLGVAWSAWQLRTGHSFSWERQLVPLCFASFLFAPYGWTYDQTLLLPAQLGILGIALRLTGSKRALLLTGLCLIQGFAFGKNILLENVSQHSSFWIPFALLALWLLAQREASNASSSQSVSLDEASSQMTAKREGPPSQ